VLAGVLDFAKVHPPRNARLLDDFVGVNASACLQANAALS
jgi:hypothetical protein